MELEIGGNLAAILVIIPVAYILKQYFHLLYLKEKHKTAQIALANGFDGRVIDGDLVFSKRVEKDTKDD